MRSFQMWRPFCQHDVTSRDEWKTALDAGRDFMGHQCAD